MTPEQSALLKKAHDSLHGARLLARGGLSDFAASRAYYAMFYAAEALLLQEGLSFSKHSAVISGFGERLVKPGKVDQEYHRYLREGFDARNVGDYDTGPGLSEDQSARQVQHAELFLELAGKLLGS